MIIRKQCSLELLENIMAWEKVINQKENIMTILLFQLSLNFAAMSDV